MSESTSIPESISTTTQPSYRVGVSTHPGKRDKNEDACATTETDTCTVVVVADGAGGHAGGEVASEIVAAEVAAYFNTNRTAVPGPALLRGALKAAQDAVRAEIQRTAKYYDMRSTALIVAATRTRAWIGHVGDSRAYLVRDGKARQLTRDDTLVQTLIEVGEIDAEQARTHSKANVLLQSIGDPRTLDYHVSEPIDVGPGDLIVACSDGLAESVREDQIAQLATDGSGEDIAGRLVKRAIDGGSTDNVTVAVVRWQKSTRRPVVATHGRVVKRRRKRGGVTPFRIAVGALVLTAAVLGVMSVRRQRVDSVRTLASPPPTRPVVRPSPAPVPEPVPPVIEPAVQPGPTLVALAIDAGSPSIEDAATVASAVPDVAAVADVAVAVAVADGGASAVTASLDAATSPVAVAVGVDGDASAMGTLWLRGLPAGAHVYVNQVEATPDAQSAVAIPAGRRVLIRIHADGHPDQNESVRVEPGRSTAIRVELASPHPATHGGASVHHSQGGAESRTNTGSGSGVPENPF